MLLAFFLHSVREEHNLHGEMGMGASINRSRQRDCVMGKMGGQCLET
jgi:hypothetical protein